MADQWIQKYLREQPFMPFGTMMNTYAQINKGTGCTVEEIEMVADRLFEKAIELIKKAYESSMPNEDDEVDIPTK